MNTRGRSWYRLPSSAKPRPGFTILELLIVVAIIVLLVAILLPSLQKFRLTAQGGVCLSNLKQIGNGMAAYATGNGGWFPAGPADQIAGYTDIRIDSNQPAELRTSDTPREGGGWRPNLYSPWQFGGKRGKWLYLEDENKNRLPETLRRPLTKEMYPGGGLDQRTPAFECPGDNGLYYYDRAHRGEWIPFGRRPVHHMVGNSYYLNLSGARSSGFQQNWRKDRKRAGQVVLANEAILYYDRAYFSPMNPITGAGPSIHQFGWHGRKKTYNMLFLDMHAEPKYIRKLYSNTFERHQDNWLVVNYIYLMDYYR